MITTERINVRNDCQGFDTAIEAVEEFAVLSKLDKRGIMHLRLLTEEMLGMVQTIAGEFQAVYYAEQDGDVYRLHLDANINMDPDKRRELISASTSGKNEAAKGIMGKIRDFIEVGMENYEEVSTIQSRYGVNPVAYGIVGMDSDAMNQAMLTWSLKQYRDGLYDNNGATEGYSEAWDELEKSIVANLADDVKVGIKKDRMQMTITKKIK